MLQFLSRKITISLVALVIFCTFSAIISLVFNSPKDLKFTTLWLTFLILSAPMFIICGVAVHIILCRFKLSGVMNIMIYVLSGVILILPYSAYILALNSSNMFYYMFIGAVAGMIYFGTQYLFEQAFYKNDSNKA